MKTPIFETSPGAGAALINTGVFVYATLYTITMFGAQGVLRFTDADLDITYSGLQFSSRSIHIDQKGSRTTAHWKRGLDVDSWVLSVMPRLFDPVTGAPFPDQINTVPWVEAARCGALDGADVQIDRAYVAAWPQPYRAALTPTAVYTIFAGRTAEIDTADTLVVITLNDYRELLSISEPRELHQGPCVHTLFDAGCQLSAAAFAVNGTCIGGTTRQRLMSTPIVPGGSGTFALGKVVFTSGKNAGFQVGVADWVAPGTLILAEPTPFAVVAGDTFTAYPGCDKTTGQCNAFANLVNFGGEPYIPDASTAL
jgi:uncharacterized phage protein (TIGR02218 family)